MMRKRMVTMICIRRVMMREKVSLAKTRNQRMYFAYHTSNSGRV